MKILIAEDELMNRRLLEVNVTKWGHEPVLATDGEQAWKTLQGPDAPSVVLLDWMMPGMDGVEICRRLRDRDEPRMVYVIMVTTNAQPGDIVEGLEAGADDYVTKPFDPQELRARVDVGIRMVELHRQLIDREASLAAARARLADRAGFEAAVGGMSDGIVTLDEQWCVAYANRAAQLLLNLLGEDYEGKSLAEVLAPFDLSKSVADLRASVEQTTDLEISRTGAGVTLWIDARITRLFDDDGNLTNVVMALRDATDRIDTRNREMRFMNSISHKLRTPLTVIAGTLDVMAHLSPERRSEAWDRLLGICQRQIKRLDETIGRLLKFRELSEKGPVAVAEPVEVAQVIETVESELRGRYPDEEVECDVSITAGAERISAGVDDLRLIIEELADNAVKFAEERPVQIAISVDRDDEGTLRVTVTDNGPGIPHEFLDRVFEGYLQIEEATTGQVKGLGLGLRIVKEVAEAHGGDVTIQSRLGEGTSVTVIYPTD